MSVYYWDEMSIIYYRFHFTNKSFLKMSTIYLTRHKEHDNTYIQFIIFMSHAVRVKLSLHVQFKPMQLS